LQRFPCLRLAYEALKQGGAWPIVLNAANEIAVGEFLSGRLSFPGIATVIEAALTASDRDSTAPDRSTMCARLIAWARAFTLETIRTLTSS
jgi:1-deoxy-D-xylulose-5-phosphate reductoisomerase